MTRTHTICSNNFLWLTFSVLGLILAGCSAHSLPAVDASITQAASTLVVSTEPDTGGSESASALWGKTSDLPSESDSAEGTDTMWPTHPETHTVAKRQATESLDAYTCRSLISSTRSLNHRGQDGYKHYCTQNRIAVQIAFYGFSSCQEYISQVVAAGRPHFPPVYLDDTSMGLQASLNAALSAHFEFNHVITNATAMEIQMVCPSGLQCDQQTICSKAVLSEDEAFFCDAIDNMAVVEQQQNALATILTMAILQNGLQLTATDNVDITPPVAPSEITTRRYSLGASYLSKLQARATEQIINRFCS